MSEVVAFVSEPTQKVQYETPPLDRVVDCTQWGA